MGTGTKGRLLSRVLGVSLAACLVAVMGLATPAQAAPDHWSITYYFDDAQGSNQVGMREVRCFQPYIIITGTQTPYFYTTDYDMC